MIKIRPHIRYSLKCIYNVLILHVSLSEKKNNTNPYKYNNKLIMLHLSNLHVLTAVIHWPVVQIEKNLN